MTFAGQMIKVKTPCSLALKEAYLWTRISQRLGGGLFSIGPGKHPATTYNTLATTFKEQIIKKSHAVQDLVDLVDLKDIFFTHYKIFFTPLSCSRDH